MTIEDKETEAAVDELEKGAPAVDDPIESDEEESTAKVDSELDEAESDEDREAIRERRRQERKSRGQRNREKLESMERNLSAVLAQNQTMQQQLASIQNANAGSQLAQVDQAIDQANNAAEHFKRVIAEATTRQDGRTVAEATEYMIASRTRAQQLKEFKDNAARAINAPRPLNPALVSKSQNFLGKNKWYGGPTSADPDSKILTALDNSLTAEGWDPTDDSYWTELEERAKKYLPHRMTRSTSRYGNPVPGGNRSSGSPDQSGVFNLSPERVKAIKDAGFWEDKTTRDKMIKSYRDYDKRNNTRG